MTQYIEYKWGYVDPKYNRDSSMSTYVSLNELKEELGEEIQDEEAIEVVLKYLTETKFGLFLTKTTKRSELWVEIIKDDRDKVEKENKADERWDEWMDGIFPSFRSDD